MTSISCLQKIPVGGEQIPGLGPHGDVLGVEVADAGQVHQRVVACTFTMLFQNVFIEKDSSHPRPMIVQQTRRLRNCLAMKTDTLAVGPSHAAGD